LPRLRDATPEQRANWDILPFGDAIEWPDVDEHVSVEGLLRGKPTSGRQAAWTRTALASLVGAASRVVFLRSAAAVRD
jgi:hypothetical protein